MTLPHMTTTRATPVSTQHLAEQAWAIMERHGDDVLVSRETLMNETATTIGQFTRLKSYVRDYITLDKGRAFLAYHGGYLKTVDPAKIAENVGQRLHRLETELSRLLSGAINPLGDDVAMYEVLVMYQEEIAHMMRTAERARRTRSRLPDPVLRTPRRQNRRKRSHNST